jgi:4-methylaminobutanoate oxidase (formaldehyde-forming)
MRPHRRALADDAFYIVTGTGFATHDFDWIRRNIPQDCDATLIDVTSAYAVLTLMGPKARDVLAPSAKAGASDRQRSAAVHALARRDDRRRAGAAQRVTYVGELGWELHVPTEFAAAVRCDHRRPASRKG